MWLLVPMSLFATAACSGLWAPSPALLRTASSAPTNCAEKETEVYQREWSPESYRWLVRCRGAWYRCTASTKGDELSKISCAPDVPAPVTLELSADDNLFPHRLPITVQVNGQPQFVVVQGEAVAATANGPVMTMPVAFPLVRQVCMGCDPIPGGGPNQCANRCWVEPQDPTLEAFGWEPRFLTRPGDITIELTDLRPVCDDSCDSLARRYGFDRMLCGTMTDPPCRAEQIIDAEPVTVNVWVR